MVRRGRGWKRRGGVTPVDITAVADDPETPLSVDVRGLRAAGAGPMWTAATAVAGVQAVLISGVDPRTRQLRFSLRDAIHGPSAGALLSAGSLAAISGSKLSASTAMTGTVLPDGSVGRVAGVAEKTRVAAAAGFTRVLIPYGTTEVLDPETGRGVDPVTLGRSVGVDVQPVKNLPDAYALMTGEAKAGPPGTPPPIDPGILGMLTRRSRESIATGSQWLTEVPVRDPASLPGPEPARIAALVSAAEVALADGDAVLAFAAAAEAEQAIREWRRQRAASGRGRLSIVELKAQIGRDASGPALRSARRCRRSPSSRSPRSRSSRHWPTRSCWGDFALTSIGVAEERLKAASTMAELDEIVGFLTVAEFEAATYMPACAESLRHLGTRRIRDVDATVDRLNVYTDLLAYAADANRVYARSIGLAADDAGYLAQLIEQSDGLTISREFSGLRSPTAKPALRLSVALLEYVETTQLVNQLTAEEGQGTDLPPNLLPIADPSVLRAAGRDRGRDRERRRSEPSPQPAWIRRSCNGTAAGEPISRSDTSRTRPTNRSCTVSSTSGSPSCNPGCSPTSAGWTARYAPACAHSGSRDRWRC